MTASGRIQVAAKVAIFFFAYSAIHPRRSSGSTDPASGFGPGAPAGRPVTISWHGMLHIACAGIGFAALVAACLVLARRFAVAGQRGWATYSRLSGVVFLAGFAGVASGSGSRAVVLGFWAAVVIAWAWITAVAARLLTGHAA
jgi:Protein of unknown function (DUF998)